MPEQSVFYTKMESELADAAAFMSKVREEKRLQMREKREAYQRAALERAAAAAAASSRVGHHKRDANGDLIADTAPDSAGGGAGGGGKDAQPALIG